ncbi:NAD(P)/FAD-dependent oxidoreductase [Rhodothermus profundi]|uniref:FADH2 O2-dependent halogenase n=1 Tax=Rhodothermus profundi TaxID=633813 RepID=A0A1M6UD49_9BACT|nr:tryptophan 7-halogenase [Rhodothermus profundi]SHK66978.1 FADH2 O2-dependent halogenase [Rhodothermus profundi]
MHDRCDVIILGAGFGGALLALILQRCGLTVTLIEKGRPRFAIGESSTPLANLYLEQIAQKFGLPELLPLTKYGRWKAAHPALPVGKKRGFTFFWHQPGRSWSSHLDGHPAYLLVAASPHDGIADTHWYRPAFDTYLTALALQAGVCYLEPAAPVTADVDASGVQLYLTTPTGRRLLTGRFIVDATGPAAWLARHLGHRPVPHTYLPERIAVFAHFRNVARADSWLTSWQAHWPYRPDDAAVHHLLDEGWAWILHFDHGITSAGLSLHASCAPARDPAACWQQVLDRYPSLKALFARATPLYPLRLLRETPSLFRTLAGPGWALLPSGAGILDPLLSTGNPLTLLGVWRLARMLLQYRATPPAEALQTYQQQTLHELEQTARLLGGLWRVLNHPASFTLLSKLYFAAASFRETRIRLGRETAPPGFLLTDHPGFTRVQDWLLAAVAQGSLPAPHEVHAALDPFDVAGLCMDRNGFYPARAEDVLNACHKIPASRDEVWAGLQQSGFLIAAPA